MHVETFRDHWNFGKMGYRAEEIESQLRVGEDSDWEFKRIDFVGDRPRRPTRNDWADEIAAFANASGGTVLAGVTDEGDVIGMSRPQIVNLDSLLVEVSTDTIKPPVRIRTHHRELSDGKMVLLVEVPASDSAHESPGGCYVRVGASKRLLAGDERLRLVHRRSRARFLWFDKQPVPGTGFGTLAEVLWKPLLSAEGATDPEASLGKMALLEDDDAGVLRATVAGVLFCTRNPEQWLPNACIMATRYRGRDRASDQIDAQEITGPLNEQIAGAVAFTVSNMQVAARKDPARSGPAPIQRKGPVRSPGQRGCSSRLFDQRKQDSFVHVRRSRGNSITRFPAEQPDGGEHGLSAIHP